MYHETMQFKQAVLILTFGLAASAADLNSVSNVYILPMSGGMDQYLALRLTTGNVMQVVTDPQRADVILTDNIGGSFDDRWKVLYPPEKPAPKKDADGKEEKADVFTVEHGISQMARGHGTYFLIDRKTRNVLWSTFARPKSADPNDVTRTAEQIAKELAKARQPKPAKQ